MCALLAVRVSWASLLRGKERDAAVGAASEGAPAPCPGTAANYPPPRYQSQDTRWKAGAGRRADAGGRAGR